MCVSQQPGHPHQAVGVPLSLSAVTYAWCCGHDAKSVTANTRHLCSLALQTYALITPAQHACALLLAGLHSELCGVVPNCCVQQSLVRLS